MSSNRSRERLLELVRRLLALQGTESPEDVNRWMHELRSSVPDPRVLGYIFAPDREMTPEEILDRAMATEVPKESSQFFSAVRSNSEVEVERWLDAQPALAVAVEPGTRWTALMVAADYGHLDTSSLLIARGADVNATDGEFTPLYLAARAGPSKADPAEDVATLLLENGVEDTIWSAAVLGDVERLEQLLVRDNVPVDRQDPLGYTPLYLAVYAAQAAAVQLLLDRGANVNYQRRELTALDAIAPQVPNAVYRKVARMLIDAGASPVAFPVGQIEAWLSHYER